VARYISRHAARHAAPRPSGLGRVRGVLGGRVLLSAAAVSAATAGVVVGVGTFGGAATADPVTLTLSSAQAQASVEEARRAAADAASRSVARTSLSEARSARAAEISAQIRARQIAQIKARKAAAERIAAAARRQQIIDNARKDPKAAAREIMGDYGFGADQWGCLEQLWTGESNWRYTAENPSSGAYGIPQSLPGSKMATVAADWRTNPVTQIRWGLQYIKSSYGSPCGAWSAWNSRYPHWY
jgi:hypothetical protein